MGATAFCLSQVKTKTIDFKESEYAIVEREAKYGVNDDVESNWESILDFSTAICAYINHFGKFY